MEAIIRRLRNDKRGISNVIVVMLSLVLMVIIVGNVVLWSYQMNQLDWEKMQEKITLTSVEHVVDGVRFSFENGGSLTTRIVAIWIINATTHMRYDANFFLNSGERGNYLRADIPLPMSNFTVRAVTERGNIAVATSS